MVYYVVHRSKRYGTTCLTDLSRASLPIRDQFYQHFTVVIYSRSKISYHGSLFTLPVQHSLLQGATTLSDTTLSITVLSVRTLSIEYCYADCHCVSHFLIAMLIVSITSLSLTTQLNATQ
jgi:hypothetical protein